ncbi:MAG: NAD(P)H-hydrate dehydratase [Christensenellales bacterium]|jgi:hydroxyethylthiazole kinase-like uncharacterized protein yjeF
MKLADGKSMKEADERAIREWGIPSIRLMEQAAKALSKRAAELAGSSKSALIFCGPGNNGGDGVGAAIDLMGAGFDVRVLLVGERQKMSGDCAEMERRLLGLGGILEDFDENGEYPADSYGVIVDALFGTGFRGRLSGPAAAAAEHMNRAKAPVVSADIPSGVHADTGSVLGPAVRADATVSFSLPKIGHFVEPGYVHCGELTVADIGVPNELLDGVATGVYAVHSAKLPKRRRISHKGDYGKVFICGGCTGYTGAPTLCARSAVRSGAGLVYLGVPEDIYAITAAKNDEAMPFPLPGDGSGRLGEEALPRMLERADSCDVTVLGPGLGRSEGLTRIVRAFLRQTNARLVLDADALFALDKETLVALKQPAVLTPHEGEFARLFWPVSDRLNDAKRAAEESGCVVVLKGHRTITAFPEGEVFVNTTGNPGMATGGTGDVLAGVIAALLCVLPKKQAVPYAVWLHGRAGDLCAGRLGEYSLTAGDMIKALPFAFLEQTQQG